MNIEYLEFNNYKSVCALERSCGSVRCLPYFGNMIWATVFMAIITVLCNERVYRVDGANNATILLESNIESDSRFIHRAIGE